MSGQESVDGSGVALKSDNGQSSTPGRKLFMLAAKY